jgi:hypothetical protein
MNEILFFYFNAFKLIIKDYKYYYKIYKFIYILFHKLYNKMANVN